MHWSEAVLCLPTGCIGPLYSGVDGGGEGGWCPAGPLLAGLGQGLAACVSCCLLCVHYYPASPAVTSYCLGSFAEPDYYEVLRLVAARTCGLRVRLVGLLAMHPLRQAWEHAV
jgi:hypothetical protein